MANYGAKHEGSNTNLLHETIPCAYTEVPRAEGFSMMTFKVAGKEVSIRLRSPSCVPGLCIMWWTNLNMAFSKAVRSNGTGDTSSSIRCWTQYIALLVSGFMGHDVKTNEHLCTLRAILGSLGNSSHLLRLCFFYDGQRIVDFLLHPCDQEVDSIRGAERGKCSAESIDETVQDCDSLCHVLEK